MGEWAANNFGPACAGGHEGMEGNGGASDLVLPSRSNTIGRPLLGVGDWWVLELELELVSTSSCMHHDTGEDEHTATRGALA